MASILTKLRGAWRRPLASTVLVAAALVVTLGDSALAAARVALVIGNGTYVKAPALQNPRNDARLMADTLRSLQFDVLEHRDLSQKEMKRAIQDFGRRVRASGPDTVALFYYAGHSVQVNGANYMIPVGADILNEADVDLEGVQVASVLSTLDFSGSQLSFVVLDACRDNPYSTGFRSAARGLARMDAPAGSLIAYATAPGQVALDGDGDNSPYTAALTEAMQTPNLTVERMFRRVRNQVIAATGERQVPWESSSLTGGDFYFKAAETPAAVATAASPTARTPVTADTSAVRSAVADSLVEVTFWQSIEDSDNRADFEAYLKRYPDGAFALLAHNRLAALTPAVVAGADRGLTPLPPPPVAATGDNADGPETLAEVAVPEREPEPATAEPAIEPSDRVARLTPPEADRAPSMTPERPPEPTVRVDPLDATLYVQRNANVRSGPSTDARRLTTLKTGTPLRATGRVRGENWTKVALADGREAFIFSPLLGSSTPAPPAPPPERAERELPADSPARTAKPRASEPPARSERSRGPEVAAIQRSPEPRARKEPKQHPFDGRWRVILLVEPGCPIRDRPFIRFPVSSQNGTVSGTVRLNVEYPVTGRIETNGSFMFRTKDPHATFSGRLSSSGGQGKWTNKHGCFGTLRVVR